MWKPWIYNIITMVVWTSAKVMDIQHHNHGRLNWCGSHGHSTAKSGKKSVMTDLTVSTSWTLVELWWQVAVTRWRGKLRLTTDEKSSLTHPLHLVLYSICYISLLKRKKSIIVLIFWDMLMRQGFPIFFGTFYKSWVNFRAERAPKWNSYPR